MAEGIESSSHWGATITPQEEGTGWFGSDRLQDQQRHQSLLTPWEQPARTRSFTERSQQDTLDALPEGQVFSLSSSRLRKTHLCLAAEVLRLPTTMGVEETRQLIEGQLISMNREPGLVQVILQERKRVALDLRLYLVDQAGVFAQASAAKDTSEETLTTNHELEELWEQLKEAHAQLSKLQRQLQEIIASHTEELKKERERAKKLWTQMSARVERLDSALTGKEELIVQLNQQLAAHAVERPVGPAAEGDAVTNVLPPLQTHLPPTEDPHEPEYPLTEYSLSPSSSLLS